MCVAKIEQARRQAFHFVAEQDADWEARLPVEDVEGPVAGLDSRDFVPVRPEILDRRNSALDALPWHPLVRSQRRLANGVLGRPARDAAQQQSLHARSIG